MSKITVIYCQECQEESFDMKTVSNRRFMFDPVNGVLILGGDDIERDSHATEFNASKAPGSFDDYVRGWLGGACRDYPAGIIHFAPNAPSKCLWLYEKAFDTLEMFRDHGAIGETVVRGLGDVWERTVSEIYPKTGKRA